MADSTIGATSRTVAGINIDEPAPLPSNPPSSASASAERPQASHPGAGASRHPLAATLLRTDLVSALDPGNDLAFRARIQSTGDGAFDVGAFRLHLQQVRDEVSERGDIPLEAKETLLEDIAAIEKAITSFTVDTKTARASLLLLRPVLSFLPLFLPLRSTPRQLKSMTVLIASYVKTNVLGLGLLFRSTTDFSVVLRHAKNRDFANNFQALALLANLFKSRQAVALAHSVKYNAAMGILSTLALAGLFYGDKMADAKNRLFRGSVRPSLDGVALSEETKTTIQRLGERTHDSYNDLKNDRIDFKAAGGRLSDSGDWQVGRILQGMARLSEDLRRLIGVQEPSRLENPDLVAKMTLAVISLLICAGCIPLFRDEPIAVVDLTADAAFTGVHMFATAFNPNASEQEALDAFKQWVGLSMVMLIVFGINEAMGDIINKSSEAFAGFATGLAVANLLLPAVLGAGAAYLMGKLILAKVQNGDTDNLEQDLQELGGMAMTNLATHLETEEAARALEEGQAGSSQHQDRD